MKKYMKKILRNTHFGAGRGTGLVHKTFLQNNMFMCYIYTQCFIVSTFSSSGIGTKITWQPLSKYDCKSY